MLIPAAIFAVLLVDEVEDVAAIEDCVGEDDGDEAEAEAAWDVGDELTFVTLDGVEVAREAEVVCTADDVVEASAADHIIRNWCTT